MIKLIDKIFGFSDLGISQTRFIPKKNFYEQEVFNTAKQNLFTENIKKIQIIAICDKNIINISPYITEEKVYKEIFFIHIELNDKKKYEKISEIVHQVIPNPIVIVFTYKNEILISIAPKRLNKQEKGKVIVEAEYNSIWLDIENKSSEEKNFLDQLYLKNFNFDNLHTFYSDIIKTVIFSGFIEIIGLYKYSKNVDLKKLIALSEKLKQIQEKILFHTNEDKRLKNFGDKVENHQKLLDTKKELELIKQEIINLTS